jgi:hypothetical protein
MLFSLIKLLGGFFVGGAPCYGRLLSLGCPLRLFFYADGTSFFPKKAIDTGVVFLYKVT